MKNAKLLPSIIAIVAGAAVAAAPALQIVIANHPLAATICATLYAVLCHLAPQPHN